MFGDFRYSTMLVVYALLMSFAAGTNLYWTVDDSFFAVLMQSDRALALCWFIVAGACLLAFIAAVIAGLRIFAEIYASSRARQRSIIPRLLLISVPYFLMFCWFAAVLLWTGGHWAPMPWAVAGTGTGWPEMHTRLTLALISLALMITTMVFTAVGIRWFLRSGDLAGQTESLWKWTGSVHSNRWAKGAILTIAVSIVSMVCGCLCWGLLLNRWPSFHEQGGGILNSSAFESWLISSGLLAAAGITAILGAKQTFSCPQA